MMLHKMGYEYTCAECAKPKRKEEMQGDESDQCIDCHEAWLKSEIAYWRPLYEGEKLAGLLEKEQP
jgi:DNA-directed RNA polymerase subunit RPC12/RpoP